MEWNEGMMTEDEALQIRSRALSAIRELNSIAAMPLDWESDEALRGLRRGLAAGIWQIDTEILGPIYRAFPHLDDLRDRDFPNETFPPRPSLL
jgi:hypothetical protein